MPERVTVRGGDGEVDIEPGSLTVGDVMIVGPGDRVATDGVIRRGRSSLDLSAITGESVPVECQPGSLVMAASINGGGVLDIEVTAPTADSSLARIVHIVEEAPERKGSSHRLAERVARPLVPGIMVIAAAIALGGSLAGDPELWLARARRALRVRHLGPGHGGGRHRRRHPLRRHHQGRRRPRSPGPGPSRRPGQDRHAAVAARR